jgi:hypothetical protein
MKNLKKIILSISSFFLILSFIWVIFISPNLLKLSDHYTDSISYRRLSNTNHELGGDWSGEVLLNAFGSVKTLRSNKNTQILSGIYNAQDLNEKSVWYVSKSYGVDKKTRKTLPGIGQYQKDSYYLFPRHLKKQEYTIWLTQYLHPINLQFIAVEKVQGLEVYHYENRNFIFDDTEGFSWLELVPEKYMVLADGTIHAWVEPSTGTIINYKGNGVAYYSDKNTRNRVQEIQTWTNQYTQDTIDRQIQFSYQQKQYQSLIEVILPLIFFIISLALFLSTKIVAEVNQDIKKINKNNGKNKQ